MYLRCCLVVGSGECFNFTMRHGVGRAHLKCSDGEGEGGGEGEGESEGECYGDGEG